VDRDSATDAGEPDPSVSEAQPDPRAQRRAARRADNRAEILDAAERVFGEHGLRDGSLRQIAQISGFSTASLYLFFENKQHLLSETVTRRGAELNAALRSVAEDDLGPLAKLHRIADVTVAFFSSHPDFRQMLRHIAGGSRIAGPALPVGAGDTGGHFIKAADLLAEVIHEGQKAGQVRNGDTRALSRLYMVLVNEHVHLAAERGATSGTLTTEEFHDLIEGALRKPAP
jgi:AcrR family transcriptional regulator